MKAKSFLFAALLAGLPLTAQVRVIASNGVKAVLEELRPQIERNAGQPMLADYATSTAQAKKIESGAPFDIAIMTSDMIDALVKAGKLSDKNKFAFAKAGVGVGIRKGAKRPDIRTPDAFKKTLLDAKSITYAGDGASRGPLEKSFERMGIAAALKPKIVLEQGSTKAAERVAKGDAELILTLTSEILPAPGVELVGPIPQEFQTYISFSGSMNAKGANSPAAFGAMKLLNSPVVGPVLKAKGMEAP